MNTKARQCLTALAAGIITGAATYGIYRLTGGAPEPVTTFPKLLLICLAGPLLEEAIFRGIAYKAAKPYTGEKWAVVLCAALFALAHWGIPQSFLAFGAGLVFGVLRVKHNTLISPILAHIAANVMLTLLQL